MSLTPLPANFGKAETAGDAKPNLNTILNELQAAVTALQAAGSGGFSSDTLIKLPNSVAALVDSLELILQLNPSTAGSEQSNWIGQLRRAGAKVQVFKFDGGATALEVNPGTTALGTPSFKVNSTGTTPSVGLFTGGAQIGYFRGDGAANLFLEAIGNNLSLYTDGQAGTGFANIVCIGAAGGHAIQINGRHQLKRGAAIAVATTITLGTDGTCFPLTAGTGTLNAIATANWQAGSVVLLECASGITITNNVAGAGGSAPILTNTGSSIVTSSTRALFLYYNGTNWIVTG